MVKKIDYPDPNICQVRYFVRELWECIVEDSRKCPYSNMFGSKCFCRYPDVHVTDHIVKIPKGGDLT